MDPGSNPNTEVPQPYQSRVLQAARMSMELLGSRFRALPYQKTGKPAATTHGCSACVTPINAQRPDKSMNSQPLNTKSYPKHKITLNTRKPQCPVNLIPIRESALRDSRRCSASGRRSLSQCLELGSSVSYHDYKKKQIGLGFFLGFRFHYCCSFCMAATTTLTTTCEFYKHCCCQHRYRNSRSRGLGLPGSVWGLGFRV